MLRSFLFCLAWALFAGTALAQNTPPANPRPSAAKETPSNATATSRREDAKANKPEANGATAGQSERRVRLRVTVDVIDPSRDVRDIIAELRARQLEAAKTHREQVQAATPDRSGSAERRDARIDRRELRDARSDQREQLRRDQQDVRKERGEQVRDAASNMRSNGARLPRKTDH